MEIPVTFSGEFHARKEFHPVDAGGSHVFQPAKNNRRKIENVSILIVWCHSLHETPEWLHGWENVTRDSIDIGLSRKLVTFQFWMNYAFKNYHVLTRYCGRLEVYLSSTCERDFHSVCPSIPDDERVMIFQIVSSSLSLVTGAIAGQLTLWCWLFASQGLCDLSQESAGHCTHTESWEQCAVIPRLPPNSLPPLLQ